MTLTDLVADLTRLLLVLVRIELLSENGEVGLVGSQTCCWGRGGGERGG